MRVWRNMDGLIYSYVRHEAEAVSMESLAELTHFNRPDQQRRHVNARRPSLDDRVGLGLPNGREPEIRLPNLPPRLTHHGEASM